MDSVDNDIRKYALLNAVEHDGKAQAKSVLGKLLAEQPELRENVLQLRSQVEDIVEQVNKMSLAKQKAELGDLPAVEKRIEKKELPDLERREKFVVRFAPNPDGALHLGNARPAVLCDEYAKLYKGKFILRYDDTDPKVKVPEKRYYKWIKEDIAWLKIKVHETVMASKRLNIYYKYAERLLKEDHAYVCTCNKESWKKLINQSKSCPCRLLDPSNQMRRWKKMFSGYKEGEAVLRIKTELDAKNPAVRDWPGFRIVDRPKHSVKKKVWPLYNFASAIDDRLLGITHIFRGQEHSTNESKQRYIYQYFKWSYPYVIILGRFSLSDMVLSKSEIREGIALGKFAGWDDPRLGTLRALKRRGFTAESIRQIIVDIGPKPNDITISLENLAAYNRRLVDKTANRYFFIPNPKRIVVKGAKLKKAKIGMHPEAKKGFRTFSLSNTFFIDADDFDTLKGLEVRLKDLCNIKLGETSVFTGAELKPLPKIQWVPAKHTAVRVILPGKEIKGYGETNIAKEKVGSIIQFERFGFVRVEKIQKDNIIVMFAHE
jgi:glutamyl-tRNA synthetase